MKSPTGPNVAAFDAQDLDSDNSERWEPEDPNKRMWRPISQDLVESLPSVVASDLSPYPVQEITARRAALDATHKDNGTTCRGSSADIVALLDQCKPIPKPHPRIVPRKGKL
jgi:hypothetical protein